MSSYFEYDAYTKFRHLLIKLINTLKNKLTSLIKSMNIFQYISSKHYIITNIKIFNSKKIYTIYFFVVIYLITLPYISLTVSQVLIIFLEIIFAIILKNHLFSSSLNTIKNSLIVYLYTILLNIYEYKNYQIKLFKINILYYCKIINILNFSTIKYQTYYLTYYSVDYINKIFTLSLIYLLIMHKISLIIKNEIVSIKILNIYIKMQKNISSNKCMYNHHSINMLFINHILEKIIENFHNIYLGIKIKNIYFKHKIINYILQCIKKFYLSLLKKQNNFNIIFYTRNINNILNYKKYI